MITRDRIKVTDLWYIIGYIATDGCLSQSKRHIVLTSKDRGHLYHIRNALGLNVKLGRKSRSFSQAKDYSYFAISDVCFYNYLLTIGLTPRKSLTLGQLTIDDKYFVDFLRGVIDGDGSISTWVHKTNQSRQWSLRIFSASKDFALWLNSKVGEHFNIQGKITSRVPQNRNHEIHVLKFGKKSARLLLKEIYYKDALALKRKKVQANLCLQSEHKMVH